MRGHSQQILALAPDQQPPRILVVDDEADNRQLLIALLAPVGFELREAGAGEEAVAITREWRPQHDIAADVDQARQLLAGARDRLAWDKRYIRKDGAVVWIHLTPNHPISLVFLTARRWWEL
jgi:CheY-like chemotaxis protein